MLTVLTLCAAALPPAIAYVGKVIVDTVVAARSAGPVPEAGGHALRWVAVELGLVAALSLTERGLSLVRQLVGARLGIDVIVTILEKALRLDLAHFEDPAFYDKLTRAQREASSRPLSLMQENFQILRQSLTLGAYVALLLRFSVLLVVGLLVATVPAFVAELTFSAAAFRLKNWRSPESRRLTYLESVLGSDRHVKEVKLFGLGRVLLERYRRLAESFYRENQQLTVRRTLWGWGLSLLSTGAFYGCYALIALATIQGRLSLGDMTLYIVAFRQGQQAFQAILTAIGGTYEGVLYMSNLFEFLALPERARPTAGAPVGAPAPSEEGIRFEGVGFRYPESEKWALRGIDVFIPRGQSLALVGQNGAGKTTFVKLLTRLYEPTEGTVRLDGRDLREWDEDELHRRIGVIFQDFNRYQLTLRENVGLGSVGHMEEPARVARAVDRGGAEDVVSAVPQGLETQLGRWFEGGVELSGGQWQKVALARAFMREEADILVLDEPTAALDAEAEHAIFQRFRTLAEGRTTILVSHRFPTVRMADRILVLEKGQMIEHGTHTDLLAARGRYAQLFTLQAQGYA
jgi:ATP-binding cassette subfamily B protein